MAWVVSAVTALTATEAIALGSAAVAGYGAVSSSKNASKDRKSADRANAEALAFEREKYDEWQSIYGPIEDNLAGYYNTLSPEYYTAMGLQNIEMERTSTVKALKETLAQRGIEDSGIALAVNLQTELQTSAKRAQVRTNAPSIVAKEKLDFLQVGLGQDPDTAMSRALEGQANRYDTRSANSATRAADAQSSAYDAIGSALTDYVNARSKRKEEGEA